MLVLEAREPGDLLAVGEFGLGLLREGDKVVEVTSADLLAIA